MNNEQLNIYNKSMKYTISQKEKTEQVAKKLSEKGIKNVFLVGCGGSLMVMYPAKYILETNSDIPLYVYNASEFITTKPKTLTKDSLVILSSFSGTTDEVVKAYNYSNKIGASTLAFSSKNSTLGDNVDYLFELKYKTGVNQSQIIMLLLFMFNIIKNNNNFDQYEDVINAIETLPNTLVNLQKNVEQDAKKFAEEYRDVDFFMVIGSGPNWGEVYQFATCNLEEMQWIKAQPVHAGEFFHGTLEIIRKDSNIIVFNGEDNTRPLIQRTLDFTNKYCNNVTTIDTKKYKLPGITKELRGYFSPLIISTIKSVYFKKLADQRNHPADTRKYMGKVEY